MSDINLNSPDFKSANKLDIALFYASIGWPIFPCGPDEPGCDPKASILDGWQRPGVATKDPELIRELWDKCPNANIGFCPEFAGLLVVDIDVKHDPSTLERWEAHTLNEQGVPDTLTADTPSGGKHLYFAGSGRSSVGVIVPGLDVDTRGAKGYVLLPGSTVEGVPYTWPEGCQPGRIAPAPEWILKALEISHQSARFGELDKVANVNRAADKLKRNAKAGDVAISGKGGNDRTYRLFAELTSFGLSGQKSFDLVAKYWNPHCLPPWDDEALLTFAANAERYSTGKNNLTVDMRGAFADQIEAAAPAVETPRKPRSPFGLVRGRAAMRKAPDIKWFLPGLIEDVGDDGAVFLIAGDPGSGKSLLAQWLCIIATCGEHRKDMTVFGTRPTRFGPTVYAANEGRTAIKRKRLDAMCRHFGLPEDEPRDFIVMNTFQANDAQQRDEWQATLDADLAANGHVMPVLIVLDTAVGMMDGLRENESGDVQAFIATARQMSLCYGCPVILIHHTGKDGQIRGSSNFTAGTVGTLIARGTIKEGKVRYDTGRIKEADDDRAFELEWVKTEDGVPMPVLAVEGTKRDVKAATRSKIRFHTAEEVGEALKRLGAIGGKTVSGTVLAGELRPIDPDFDDDRPAYEKLLEDIAAQLKRQARENAGKSCLRCYAVKLGTSRTAPISWGLPEAE